MQSPEPPSNLPNQGSTPFGATVPQKSLRWSKMLTQLLISGHLKPETLKSFESVAQVVLSVSFAAVSTICWVDGSNDSDASSVQTVFYVMISVLLIVSVLKSTNVSINKLNLKPITTILTSILKALLIGLLCLYSKSQRTTIILSINLVSGIEILAVNSILCRIVVISLILATEDGKATSQLAIFLTNMDFVLQGIWVFLLYRRQLTLRSSGSKSNHELKNRRKKLLAIKSPNKPTSSSVKVKTIPVNIQVQNDVPSKCKIKLIPKPSASTRNPNHRSEGDLRQYNQASQSVKQKDQDCSSSNKTPEIEIENVSAEIDYRMDIPVQQTTSFRRAQILQTDPEAQTVKGKKCSDSRNVSPRSGQSVRPRSSRPEILSCKMLDKHFKPKRGRSITPSNTISELQPSRRKINLGMYPASPKTGWQMSQRILGTPIVPLGQSQPPARLKSRVFAEYFEMIDDLVLIADQKLSVLANNFNPNVEARTIKQAACYFDLGMLRNRVLDAELDAYFLPPVAGENSGIHCTEQTLLSLGVVFEAFNYRQTRVSDRERYDKLKISNILGQLEQTFFQRRQTRQRGKPEGSDKLWSVASGPASKGLAGLRSCNYSISEVLYLIKEYLHVIEANTLKYHFSNTLIFTFFLQGNVQLKIRLVSVDSTYYILLIAENVSEKVELAEVNCKLNYSYMLMKSLSNELKTPVHQVIQVLKELELLLEVRAASDPQLLNSVQKFEQIAGGLDITVGNILDYASILNKTIQLKKTQFAVKPFLEELVCCFLEKCNLKKIGLLVDCDPELIMSTDYDRLKGVLFIFLDNSVKFTHKGGISLRAQLIDRKIYFKVIDSGNGIKQRDLDVISKILSDPFSKSTTKDAAGLGFGMRVASNILRLLQSKKTDLLAIDSKLDQGTTIQFEISQGIAGSDQMFTSSISSQESSLTKRSKNDAMSLLKFEEKKTQFANDRLQLKASSGLVEQRPSNQGTQSMDSSKLNVPQVAERSKSRPPIQSKLGVDNKLTQDLIKRKGFVKGIGNRTLRSLELGVLSRSLSPKKQTGSSEGLPVYPSKPIKFIKFLSHQTQNERVESSARNVRGFAADRPELDSDIGEQVLSSHKPKVLIVDDEIINLEFGKHALQRIGFFVYSANSGEEALEIINSLLVERISLDVILMDYNMPKLRGDEVVRIILDQKYRPIVGKASIYGLTAQTDDKTIQECLLAGMHRVFAKPFDFFDNKALLLGGVSTETPYEGITQVVANDSLR